ncbi:hypothetical protein [Bradyrhizobium sp. 1]|uniref:hypothetical protein n=1 Tax=Bradyrhizobium sp. 1 TaxID=241591 RepID=UPI001FF7FE93|nr:hypothetical protein [Bradyrhizobium sp. 1]MCK1390973.1 hypothetical protein [Bradyrhizobium sp. 1]
MTANNSPFIRSAHVETRLDLTIVLGFYPAALAKSGCNKTDDAAVVTVNERTTKLAAHAGENLANSDNTAGELPDGQKLDLPPGKYKVSLTVNGSVARSREFEVAANETWGLLVETNGVLLPVRLF